MADENGIDADKVLEDGVITSCTLRHLSDTLDREEREEKLLNGSLTMVCTYPEVSLVSFCSFIGIYTSFNVNIV
jgi:hypothetical protein